MSESYENRRRRRAVVVFTSVYVAFMLTVIGLQIVHSFDLGYGFRVGN